METDKNQFVHQEQGVPEKKNWETPLITQIEISGGGIAAAEASLGMFS